MAKCGQLVIELSNTGYLACAQSVCQLGSKSQTERRGKEWRD